MEMQGSNTIKEREYLIENSDMLFLIVIGPKKNF